MSNNSTFNEVCPLLSWYRKTGEQIGVGVYYIFTPFYLIFGLLAHILCLRAFLKRAKKEKAFVYQVMESISKLCAIIFRSIYVVTVNWLTGKYVSGIAGQWWFSCYGCMWFTAMIPTATMNAFFTTSELLSIFVIYNRIMALGKPIQYKNTNHKRNQIFVALFCFGVGFSTSVFHYFRFNVINLDGKYKYVVDGVYEKSVTYMVLSQTRNILRGVSLLPIYIGNVLLICLFKKHRKEIKTKLHHHQNSAKETEDAETTLTIICLCQSLFMTISATGMISFYAALTIKPSFGSCESLLISPIQEGLLELIEVCDFYLACFVSRNFRKMVFSGVPIFSRFVSSFVIPL